MVRSKNSKYKKWAEKSTHPTLDKKLKIDSLYITFT